MEKEERRKRRDVNIRVDPIMQIAQKSLPVLAAEVLKWCLFVV